MLPAFDEIRPVSRCSEDTILPRPSETILLVDDGVAVRRL